MTTTQPEATRRFIRWALSFELAVLVFAVGLGWLVGYPAWGHLPNEPKTWLGEAGLGVVASLPMVVALLFMINVPVWPWKPLVTFVDREVAPLFRGAKIGELALVSILAGLGEEILFRGVAYDLLNQWWGVTWAIVLSSVLFGLVHYLTLSYFVVTALVGWYFCWLVSLREGSLVVPMVTHALYDFVALAYWSRRRFT